MSTHPRKPAKARVESLYVDSKGMLVNSRAPDRRLGDRLIHTAQITCPTKKQAALVCRLHGMDNTTRTFLVLDAINRVAYFPQSDYRHRITDAVLAVLGLRT